MDPILGQRERRRGRGYEQSYPRHSPAGRSTIPAAAESCGEPGHSQTPASASFRYHKATYVRETLAGSRLHSWAIGRETLQTTTNRLPSRRARVADRVPHWAYVVSFRGHTSKVALLPTQVHALVRASHHDRRADLPRTASQAQASTSPCRTHVRARNGRQRTITNRDHVTSKHGLA